MVRPLDPADGTARGPARDESRAQGASGRGFGRLLVAVYGVFAISAGARAGYELVTKFSDAPLAYSLSAFAALVYVVATVALARGRGVWRTVAWVAVAVELAGVLSVGTLSVADAAAFPDSTVWSAFGAGYGYVPLVLPFVGLWWLWRTRPAVPAGDPVTVRSDQDAPSKPEEIA
ncbi:hypothetical protein CLV28_1513 [Sediminihabitans luteus]|uniref:Integral membrane protein n=1 Tax=Sediminihabitans luteus TaxID=1138585 RepID=A0A2M9CQ36_9CELL|nr:hypothetical protein CLV28_1513 [Sediminihabitans luteus]GII98061.1 hypothetical protein Slu03_04390 [Sediminihabitans luteus]